MSGDRELDVVVFGATGFAGRLVAGYLAGHAPGGVGIALAGRSEQRLTDVRAELGAAASAWPLLVADSADPVSVAELAKAARVVVSTVGPYGAQGLALVQACAAVGTDYADLSPTWATSVTWTGFGMTVICGCGQARGPWPGSTPAWCAAATPCRAGPMAAGSATGRSPGSPPARPRPCWPSRPAPRRRLRRQRWRPDTGHGDGRRAHRPAQISGPHPGHPPDHPVTPADTRVPPAQPCSARCAFAAVHWNEIKKAR